MVLQRIFIGLILTALGVVSLKYNFKLVGITGSQDWIESRLGAGTTYTAYKLFSLFLVIAGILYISGLGDPVLRYLLSPLSSIFNQTDI